MIRQEILVNAGFFNLRIDLKLRLFAIKSILTFIAIPIRLIAHSSACSIVFTFTFLFPDTNAGY